MATDLLGHQISAAEAALLEIYTSLRALAASPELAPCAVAGVRAALAHISVLVGDLALEFEHLLDEGV